jgi:hypothetical protein
VRACYVPVRLAATVMALAAATGCMSVGDDAGRPSSSPTAGRHDGAAPDGGSVTSGGVSGGLGGAAARVGSPKPDEPGAVSSASPSASASGGDGRAKGNGAGKPTAGETSKHGSGGGGEVPPAPTVGEPDPTGSPADPSPTTQPDPPSPTPTTAQPSSSAPGQATQLVQREPAPRAGYPAE